MDQIVLFIVMLLLLVVGMEIVHLMELVIVIMDGMEQHVQHQYVILHVFLKGELAHHQILVHAMLIIMGQIVLFIVLQIQIVVIMEVVILKKIVFVIMDGKKERKKKKITNNFNIEFVKL